MAVIFELYESGKISADGTKLSKAEVSLTQHSIKQVITHKDIVDLMDANDDVKSLELRGTINTEKPEEGEEVDSISKLISWSIEDSQSEKCYKDAYIKITDATGKTESEEIFHDLYSIYYSEEFTDKSGHGEFKIIMKEKARIV